MLNKTILLLCPCKIAVIIVISLFALAVGITLIIEAKERINDGKDEINNE